MSQTSSARRVPSSTSTNKRSLNRRKLVGHQPCTRGKEEGPSQERVSEPSRLGRTRSTAKPTSKARNELRGGSTRRGRGFRDSGATIIRAAAPARTTSRASPRPVQPGPQARDARVAALASDAGEGASRSILCHSERMLAEELLKIGELFEALGWPTVVDRSGPIPALFERYCRMAARLSPDQRTLVLELTKHYRWFREEERRDLLLTAWADLCRALPAACKHVVVAPLLKPRSKRPKSSDALWYQLQEYRANLTAQVENRRLHFAKTGRGFRKIVERHPDAVLVLVDDYVGSGETASGDLSRLADEMPVLRTELPFLLVLAVQEAALSALSPTCRVVSATRLRRGISDEVPAESRAAALNIMNSIGVLLEIPTGERLGYAATEALATLSRTPNNTFPVFWTNRKVDGVVWDSPFTRYSDR